MVKKKQTKAQTVVETPATVEAPVDTKEELVMTANFVPEEKPVETPEKTEIEKTAETTHISSTVVLTNCTQNTICISTGTPGISITVQPREIKMVSRSDLKELMKQEMVRRYFDKGLLTSNMEADEKSTSDATVPNELKGTVERHQDGSTVSASVKKFEKQGTVSINLG